MTPLNLVIIRIVLGQLGYLVSESFRGWKQHRTVILPSLVTIFLCSLLLASSSLFLGGAMRVIDTEKTLYTIEAFLPGPIPDDSVAAVRSRLLHMKHVDSVEYVSADSALADFRRHFSGDMLDLVDDNPIPPFFRIKLDDRSKTPVDLIELRRSIARDGVFEEVQAPVDWVNRIAEWKFKMVFWPVTICVLLLVTLSLIICNSVRLSLLSRKLLVENMKYAGGSTFFIQFPFVLEGFAQGLIGSVSAVIVLWMVLDAVTESFPIVGSYVDGFGGILFLVVFAVSILSAYFSFHTVRGFLKIKRNEQE